jgi:hypothetical protein
MLTAVRWSSILPVFLLPISGSFDVQTEAVGAAFGCEVKRFAISISPCEIVRMHRRDDRS